MLRFEAPPRVSGCCAHLVLEKGPHVSSVARRSRQQARVSSNFFAVDCLTNGGFGTAGSTRRPAFTADGFDCVRGWEGNAQSCTRRVQKRAYTERGG